jgi:hypothetical protein
VRLRQVIVTHDAKWGKWPDTHDKDYSDVLAKRVEWHFGELTVECRYLPAYKCYLDAGLPGAVVPTFPWIDNTVKPLPPVMDAQLAALKAAAADCHAVLWEHSYQCWPEVAQYVPRLFKLAALSFGDDCPGSSDVKTFPVARNFDALIYTMYVWDQASGKLTHNEYADRGLGACYHIATGPSMGLAEWLRRERFSVSQKAAEIRAGNLPRVGLCWVGFGHGGNPMRAALIKALNALPVEVDGVGKVALYGISMRDGHLGVRNPLHQDDAMGQTLAPLYVNSALGVNIQQSSIFNSRLIDLWLCGVGQIICDPHGELERYGIRAGEHYIAFDGTPEGMLAAAREWSAKPEALADLIERAAEKAALFSAESSWTAAYGRMYADFLKGRIGRV